MLLRNVFGPELLDEYRNGKKEFSGIHIQFADLSGNPLENIVIKDSKIHFTLFRFCKLNNCRFVNCEIFFGGFKGADLSGAVFEKCKMDYCLFESAIFRDTKMLRCGLSWCGMFSTDAASLDTSSSTLFKVFSNVSEFTQKDADAAFSGLMPVIQNLDFEIRTRMEDLLNSVAKRIGAEPSAAARASGYGKADASRAANPISAYQNLNSLVEGLIHAYAAKNPYRSKTPYEKSGSYKDIHKGMNK